MSNPDFNDPRNIRRDRKGQQRLVRHPDDVAGAVGDIPPSPDPRFGDRAATPRAGQPRRAQDAGPDASEPLAAEKA